MRFNIKVITELPNQGVYFVLAKGDIIGVECLEEYLGFELTQAELNRINKKHSKLNDDEMIWIEL